MRLKYVQTATRTLVLSRVETGSVNRVWVIQFLVYSLQYSSALFHAHGGQELAENEDSLCEKNVWWKFGIEVKSLKKNTGEMKVVFGSIKKERKLLCNVCKKGVAISGYFDTRYCA